MFVLLYHGCGSGAPDRAQPLKYKAANGAPDVLAVYEGWFGHPRHISVGYSSHDPAAICPADERSQGDGDHRFVVDWYGDREPFIDRSYQLVQEQAEKNKFKVAMMYDETNQEDGATDEAIADFTMFHDTYLTSKSPGHKAYLTYEGRPVIFIFPKGRHTDWDKVRAVVNTWDPAPLLIQENLPGQYANDFDGFYAWVNPGLHGWKPDGSNWGEQYLDNFYQTMGTKYPDKIIVGGAWAQFDDGKASWGLNRHIARVAGRPFKTHSTSGERCFRPTMRRLSCWWRHGTITKRVPPIENGIPSCGKPAQRPDALQASTIEEVSGADSLGGVSCRD